MTRRRRKKRAQARLERQRRTADESREGDTPVIQPETAQEDETPSTIATREEGDTPVTQPTETAQERQERRRRWADETSLTLGTREEGDPEVIQTTVTGWTITPEEFEARRDLSDTQMVIANNFFRDQQITTQQQNSYLRFLSIMLRQNYSLHERQTQLMEQMSETHTMTLAHQQDVLTLTQRHHEENQQSNDKLLETNRESARAHQTMADVQTYTFQSQKLCKSRSIRNKFIGWVLTIAIVVYLILLIPDIITFSKALNLAGSIIKNVAMVFYTLMRPSEYKESTSDEGIVWNVFKMAGGETLIKNVVHAEDMITFGLSWLISIVVISVFLGIVIAFIFFFKNNPHVFVIALGFSFLAIVKISLVEEIHLFWEFILMIGIYLVLLVMATYVLFGLFDTYFHRWFLSESIPSASSVSTYHDVQHIFGYVIILTCAFLTYYSYAYVPVSFSSVDSIVRNGTIANNFFTSNNTLA